MGKGTESGGATSAAPERVAPAAGIERVLETMTANQAANEKRLGELGESVNGLATAMERLTGYMGAMLDGFGFARPADAALPPGEGAASSAGAPAVSPPGAAAGPVGARAAAAPGAGGGRRSEFEPESPEPAGLADLVVTAPSRVWAEDANRADARTHVTDQGTITP